MPKQTAANLGYLVVYPRSRSSIEVNEIAESINTASFQQASVPSTSGAAPLTGIFQNCSVRKHSKVDISKRNSNWLFRNNFDCEKAKGRVRVLEWRQPQSRIQSLRSLRSPPGIIGSGNSVPVPISKFLSAVCNEFWSKHSKCSNLSLRCLLNPEQTLL